jgi:hypothetical protein
MHKNEPSHFVIPANKKQETLKRLLQGFSSFAKNE